MSKISEEEIIKYIKNEIEDETDTFHWFDENPNNATRKQIEESILAHQGILDLYNKEKEKNEELEEYANWHIEHLTENIADYIDDDKKGNASIIGEFKEERQHWKDIIRIMNNEKTYIDYKNY